MIRNEDNCYPSYFIEGKRRKYISFIITLVFVMFMMYRKPQKCYT